MVNYPFVTVGIICRNEEKNIANTLKYLISQTYPQEKYEIIIVDGNSTDNTVLCAKKVLKDTSISFKIINEKDCKNNDKWVNYGHSFARNCVLNSVSEKSKYIAWIDADCHADKKWIQELVETMENHSNNNTIAWAGWRRRVEIDWDISKKELALNYYFTSKIVSLGNPAFSESKQKFMPSIAWYNSIYKAEILKKYSYNTLYPFNTDDIEINYRLQKNNFQFLNTPWAVIWHRMDSSIIVFFKQMVNYGKWAVLTSIIHKKIVRIYIIISILYIIGIILTPVFLQIDWILHTVTIIGWVFIFFISFIIFIENIMQTKSLWSLIVFILFPWHILMYGIGVIKGLYYQN